MSPPCQCSRRVGRVLDDVGLREVAAEGLADARRPGPRSTPDAHLATAHAAATGRQRRRAPGCRRRPARPRGRPAQALGVELHGLAGAAARPSAGSRPAASRTAAEAATALPAAAAMRPQLGRRRGRRPSRGRSPTTARATARASMSSRAPLTPQVMRLVAPSPSAACWRASERATASTRSRERGPRPPIPASRGAAPEAPDATSSTVSFVDWSPSTLSWSQVRATMRPQDGLEHLGRGGRVGEHEAEHGGHVGVDHAHALDDAADGHRHRDAARPGQRHREGGRLGTGIGRPQGLARRPRGPSSSARSSPATTVPMAVSTRSTGSRVPMSPVDSASTWLGVGAHGRRPGSRPGGAGRPGRPPRSRRWRSRSS